MVRKARKSKGTWTNQNHDILGKAQIYRVLASGDVWQFRMWIPDEKKYVRKTLRTKDLETAMQLLAVDSKMRQEMGRAAHLRVSDKFSHIAQLDRLIELYFDLLKSACEKHTH